MPQKAVANLHLDSLCHSVFLWLWVRWVGMFFKPRRANEKRKINEVVLSFRKFALRGFLLLPRRARLAFLQLVTKWIIEKRLSVPFQDIGQGHIQGTNVLSQYDLVRGDPLTP